MKNNNKLKGFAVVIISTALASCFSRTPSAYREGYRSGCVAGKEHRGVHAIDGEVRAKLQENYYSGWKRGYISCMNKSIFE